MTAHPCHPEPLCQRGRRHSEHSCKGFRKKKKKKADSLSIDGLHNLDLDLLLIQGA